MKKLLFAAALLGLLVAFGLPGKTSALDTTALDQYSKTDAQMKTSTSWAESMYQDTVNEQGFIPTTNRLSYVNLNLGDPYGSINGNKAVRLTITSYDRNTVIASKVILPSFQGTPWVNNTPVPYIKTFDFEPDLALTPATRYIMQLEILSAGTIAWLHNSTNSYTRGVAYVSGASKDWDFDFQTYGYTWTPSTPYVPPTTEDTTTTTNIPQTTVSTSIQAPTALAGDYNTTTKAVTLTWKASATADIDGYILARSDDGKTYKDLFKTKKAELAYSDGTVTQGTTEKSYSYQVRAYKGTASSKVSNTAVVQLPPTEDESIAENTDTVAPVAGSNVNDEGFFTMQNVLYISLGIVILLLLILLGVLIYLKKKKNMTLSDLFHRKPKPQNEE